MDSVIDRDGEAPAAPLPVSVRVADAGDAAGIARILNAVIADGRFSLLDTPFTETAERAYIQALGPRGFIHVAELAGAGIVGFQTVEPWTSFVTHEFDHVATMGTWVDQDHRRAGVGRTLWAASLARALANGFEKILTDVRADNPGSIDFHRSLGFTIVGIAKRHARVERRYVDVVFIERQLGETAYGDED
jgi:L-amino acid N-acyltransferase YncA